MYQLHKNKFNLKKTEHKMKLQIKNDLINQFWMFLCKTFEVGIYPYLWYISTNGKQPSISLSIKQYMSGCLDDKYSLSQSTTHNGNQLWNTTFPPTSISYCYTHLWTSKVFPVIVNTVFSNWIYYHWFLLLSRRKLSTVFLHIHD